MKTLKHQKRAAARNAKGASTQRTKAASKSKTRAVETQPVVNLTANRTAPSRKSQPPANGNQAHPDVPYQTAVRNFELGLRSFQKQDYAKAAEIFEKLVDSDARDVAERAQMHLRLCRQRTGRPASIPKSAEELYALGVACLNARKLAAAIEHLNKADKLKSNQDHIQYALAVAHALDGNTEQSFVHLEIAFALRPENRFHARRDEDFQSLAGDPRFRRLIFPTGARQE